MVQLDAARPQKETDEDKFYANLALKMDKEALGIIANDLYEAVETDDRSRHGSLEIYKKALDYCENWEITPQLTGATVNQPVITR